jgi:micrococcal nuclease
MPGRGPSLGALALLLIAVAALLFGGDEDGERSRGDEGERGEATTALVTRAVDGDTVEVRVDGTEEDVRYIGVDTPESVAPGQPVECFGREAASFNRRLVEGRSVRLVYDRERRDRYGRLLAYVYLRRELVNETLLRRGLARTLTIPPNDRFAERFDRIEQAAGSRGRGLWSAC